MELRTAGGTPDSVVSDFDTAAWQDVLKEASNEFTGGKRDAAGLLSLVIAVAETDLTVVDGFDPAVGDGDAEDVAAEIVEDLVTASCRLTVNDPWFLPQRWRDSFKQSCFF